MLAWLATLTGGTTTLSLLGMKMEGNGLVLLAVILLFLIAGLIFWKMTINNERAERIILGVYGKNDQPKITESDAEEDSVKEEEETLQP